MSKHLWKLIAVLAVFGLLAAACGDDDDDTTSETPADEVSEPAAEEPTDMDEGPEPAPAVEEPTDTDMDSGEMDEEPEPAPAVEEPTDTDMEPEPAEEEPTDMDSGELGEITTIKLVANPWNGSAANVAVAAQLLEQIGYTVEITDLEENSQWSAINTGDLHASLEVWPSGHAQNRIDFIDNPEGHVVDAGLLGPVGQIGWYMPAYMVERHPELATVEGFQDPELASLFATAETGDRGQVLHGDPSWVTFEQEIIDDLGLNLEIVYGGSEEALLAAFDGAFSREEPVLSYFWTPHSAFNTFDLVALELPEGYYPPDNLFKIVWDGLEEGAPAAWHFLHNFNYTTADQVSMLAAIESEGKSPEEAAAEWIAANEDVWRAWMP